MQRREARARAVRPPHHPVRRRGAPFQQGAAGRLPAVRRAGPDHLRRRDDREPVVRGERRAAFARRGLRAGAASEPTSSARCSSAARGRADRTTARSAQRSSASPTAMRGGCSTWSRDPARRGGGANAGRRRSSSSRRSRKNLRRFDKGGEQFYDQISALHKSVRGSRSRCGALLAGAHARRRRRSALHRPPHGAHGGRGHRPRRPARAAAWRSTPARPTSGWARPEGELALAEAVVYLALAAKSNAVYDAYNAGARVRLQGRHASGAAAHLRNAPTRLMKDLGYGKDYRYAHDEAEALRGGRELLPRRHAGASGTSPPSAGWKRRSARSSSTCARSMRAAGRRTTSRWKATRTSTRSRSARASRCCGSRWRARSS